MIVRTLQRALDSVLKEDPAAFDNASPSDLNRLIVHRYLAQAMSDQQLPDDRQREVVREFRDLCAGLNDPENLHPVVRGDIQARMERGSRTPFMQDRAALILRLVIDLACWRHPQRLSSSIDPPTTDFHVDLGADAESDTPFLSATVRERGITL